MPKVKKPSQSKAADPEIQQEEGMEKIAPSLLPLAVPIESLTPDPDNARLHGDRSIEVIMESLKAYGQKKPIVVRKETMVVVAGNGTLEAATKLGWKSIAANIESMTDEEATGYALADNKTAEESEWNYEVVKRQTALLQELGHGAIGWSADELAAVRAMDFEPKQDQDKTPDIPPTAAVKLGELWKLGDHRLICGDSADVKVASRLMGNDKGILLATDPPYGVEFGKANHNPTAKGWQAIEGDAREGAELREWLTSVLKMWIGFVRKESAFYIWSASKGEGHRFYEAMIDAGINVASQIIWAKNVFSMGQSDYQWKHEPCWYGFFKGQKHRWFGGRDKTTVWEIKRLASAAYLHPMQKPVELYEIPIQHHTKAGEIVVEPFCGSGTQFIAAHKLGRICYGVELDPRFVDVTLQRFWDFTGIEPIREDGLSFSKAKKKVGR